MTFYGRYTVVQRALFPARDKLQPVDSVGTISSRGSVTVSNCDDAPCGFCRAFSLSVGGDLVHSEIGRIFGQLRRDAEH